MIWALIGILIGLIIGLALNLSIPIELIKYTAVIIVGILDSLLGAIKAEITEKKYDPGIFLSGFLVNILLALGITFLGEKLGLELYLAATVAFTLRIFSNVSIIRRSLLARYKKRSR